MTTFAQISIFLELVSKVHSYWLQLVWRRRLVLPIPWHLQRAVWLAEKQGENLRLLAWTIL